LLTGYYVDQYGQIVRKRGSIRNSGAQDTYVSNCVDSLLVLVFSVCLLLGYDHVVSGKIKRIPVDWSYVRELMGPPCDWIITLGDDSLVFASPHQEEKFDQHGGLHSLPHWAVRVGAYLTPEGVGPAAEAVIGATKLRDGVATTVQPLKMHARLYYANGPLSFQYEQLDGIRSVLYGSEDWEKVQEFYLWLIENYPGLERLRNVEELQNISGVGSRGKKKLLRRKSRNPAVLPTVVDPKGGIPNPGLQQPTK
jgi:hypothetical protein